MNCYSCDQPATNACKRCAKPFCEDHGSATYCADCLRPSSALPSFNLYRGALLAMLIGTAVAVYLIMRPPGETNGAAPVVVGKSTPTVTAAAGAQSTAQAQTSVSTTRTPGLPPGESTIAADASATPSDSGTPTPSGTESPFGEYTVKDGDTLFDIANANLPPGDNPVSFAKAIAALNGLNYDAPILQIGKKLLLPKPKPSG